MGRFWPMEKLERSGRLVDHAVGIAGRLGFPLRDAATGGASDANTTSGMGVPGIDGLGPIGGNDHSPAEYLEVDSIVPRTVLLAALILALGRDPVVGELGRGAPRPRVAEARLQGSGVVGSRLGVAPWRDATERSRVRKRRSARARPGTADLPRAVDCGTHHAGCVQVARPS